MHQPRNLSRKCVHRTHLFFLHRCLPTLHYFQRQIPIQPLKQYIIQYFIDWPLNKRNTHNSQRAEIEETLFLELQQLLGMNPNVMANVRDF